MGEEGDEGEAGEVASSGGAASDRWIGPKAVGEGGRVVRLSMSSGVKRCEVGVGDPTAVSASLKALERERVPGVSGLCVARYSAMIWRAGVSSGVRGRRGGRGGKDDRVEA